MAKLKDFKVGMRVRVLRDLDNKGIVGKLGTVRVVDGSVGVEFDEYMGGHDLSGRCKYGHGWYVPMKNLTLIEEGKDGKRDFDWDWDIETDVYTPKAIEVPIVLLSFSYTELFQLRFAHRHGFKYAAKMNNELWFFKEDPNYPSAFKITEVI